MKPIDAFAAYLAAMMVMIFFMIGVIKYGDKMEEQALLDAYEVETFSIGNFIEESDDISYFLKGITKTEIIIGYNESTGKTSENTYPSRMNSFIELEGTNVKMKIRSVSSYNGNVEFYVDRKTDSTDKKE